MRPRARGLGARRLPLGAFLVAAVMTVAVIGAWTPTVRGDRAEKGEARTSQASRVVWKGDYETGDFGQWERVLRETAAEAHIVAGRNPIAQGRYAARFILGPQITQVGSRVEAHQPDEAASGGLYGSETWYRWAEYVPSDSRFAPHPSFNHLVQWHPEAECSGAVLSVNGVASPPRLLFRVRGGDILDYDEGCEFRFERTFDLGRLPRDRWLRFRLHVKWSADPSEGLVELWMNGGRKIEPTRLATAAPDVGTYLRQGIYRFRCTCRTLVYGDAMKVTQVAP
jgi:hypothetical protein